MVSYIWSGILGARKRRGAQPLRPNGVEAASVLSRVALAPLEPMKLKNAAPNKFNMICPKIFRKGIICDTSMPFFSFL
jgi:hypothetical protein